MFNRTKPTTFRVVTLQTCNKYSSHILGEWSRWLGRPRTPLAEKPATEQRIRRNKASDLFGHLRFQ